MTMSQQQPLGEMILFWMC
uniref:Uncharacterized protein n=1 Tax=Arundo donax TaxID=35708 RepID=A0A0A9GNB0_ARUDO